MIFKWIGNLNPEKSLDLQLKSSRNISDDFFVDDSVEFNSYPLMKDIDRATTRILSAIEKQEKICIYGHDDLDGITSTLILYDFLKKIGAEKVFYFIPNRLTDNHGIQDNFIQKALVSKINLVITVDGGIGCVDAIKKMKENNIETIITDHHTVNKELPEAYAVVNPKQFNCKYPFKMLAGVGVIYFVIKFICDYKKIEIPRNYLIWTVIGSYADKVPMNGVNRILFRKAFNIWKDSQDEILLYLKNKYLYDYNVESIIKFIIKITCLLTNGRESNGENKALRFLISREQERNKLFFELNEELSQFEDKKHVLFEWINKNFSNYFNLSYVYYDKRDILSPDVMGLVASIISSKLKIPVLILKKKNGILFCEARCTEGFDLIEAFNFAKSSFIQFGGHRKAAGFTIEEEKLYLFEKFFGEYVEINKDNILKNKKINIDATLTFKQIVETDLQILDKFYPFGIEHENPIIMVKDSSIEEISSRFNLKDIPDMLDKKEVQKILFKIEDKKTLQFIDAESFEL